MGCGASMPQQAPVQQPLVYYNGQTQPMPAAMQHVMYSQPQQAMQPVAYSQTLPAAAQQVVYYYVPQQQQQQYVTQQPQQQSVPLVVSAGNQGIIRANQRVTPQHAEATPPFPRNGVRLAWLRRFADKCKAKTYTWTAKNFLKAEHGGGGDAVVHVSIDNLQEHRARIHAAGKDGDGKPTSVQYADIPFELMTTNDVCFGIVKPATEQVKTSYADMLASTEPREVKAATVFVSHAWKYTFVNVVDALSSLSENAYVWFDVFTVNQHASLQVPPDWWFTTFKVAVASIGHTVLILMPWDDPIPLTRAWCIWEILSTIDDRKAKLEICLPAVEQTSFADFLVEEGAGEVTVKMVGMDVQRAEAWKKEDRDAILNAVEMYPGGPSEVNKLIKDQMRSWVVESAVSALGTLDKKTRATSELLMDVAELLRQQGKYDDAEPLHREALDGRRRELGDAHPDTLMSINNLALLLDDQGKYADAESLYREALDGSRRDLGDADPRTLVFISNLATLLTQQGKYDDAEPLHREALDGRRRELGYAHPDTLMSINNLAALLDDQGKYADAESLYRKALDGSRRDLGDADPRTLVFISNLAELLRKQGKYDDAEPLHREALDGRRRELGYAHPDTLMSINNLAALLDDQGKYADAESLYREALDGSRRDLGDADPRTLVFISNLAELLRKQGKYDDAEPLHREALDGRRRELGYAHPDTLMSINNLAALLDDQGKYADAESLYREALDGYRRELGDAHPSTLMSISNLAVFLNEQGKNADAEPLFREALDGRRRVLGDAHPDYALSCYNIANLLMEQEKFSEAAIYLDQAAHAYEQSYGTDHEEARDARAIADECRQHGSASCNIM
ncbi:EF-hand domain-containing protein [Pseudoscourfieldia marina]